MTGREMEELQEQRQAMWFTENSPNRFFLTFRNSANWSLCMKEEYSGGSEEIVYTFFAINLYNKK